MDAIARRMADIQKSRGETQPVKSRTGGSTFANPEGHKAWELIDEADCRGLTRGGAQVSPQHCNFLINTGNATAADLEGLGEECAGGFLKIQASSFNGKSVASAGRPAPRCRRSRHDRHVGKQTRGRVDGGLIC